MHDNLILKKAKIIFKSNLGEMIKKQKENRYLPSAVGISEFEVDLGKTLTSNNKKLAGGSRRSI